jgi:hypothetical protein
MGEVFKHGAGAEVGGRRHLGPIFDYITGWRGVIEFLRTEMEHNRIAR